MNIARSLLLPALLVLSIMACKKPNLDPYAVAFEDLEPLVLHTSLADTLPARSFQELQIKDVLGLKINYLQGGSVQYFEYKADANTVLKVLAKLPFPKDVALADTGCRRVAFEQLQLMALDVSPTEYASASFFWQADADDHEFYECIKSPVRHQVLISKSSGKVLHRIDHI
ncbi:MAG: hypothetical protein ACOYXT_23030 [Bacteroidota bacterium]